MTSASSNNRQTHSSTFRVVDLTERDVWLRDRETGLTVAIERRAVSYSPEIRTTIAGLSAGELIDATLQAQNAMCTIWHFVELDPRL